MGGLPARLWNACCWCAGPRGKQQSRQMFCCCCCCGVFLFTTLWFHVVLESQLWFKVVILSWLGVGWRAGRMRMTLWERGLGSHTLQPYLHHTHSPVITLHSAWAAAGGSMPLSLSWECRVWKMLSCCSGCSINSCCSTLLGFGPLQENNSVTDGKNTNISPYSILPLLYLFLLTEVFLKHTNLINY